MIFYIVYRFVQTSYSISDQRQIVHPPSRRLNNSCWLSDWFIIPWYWQRWQQGLQQYWMFVLFSLVFDVHITDAYSSHLWVPPRFYCNFQYRHVISLQINSDYVTLQVSKALFSLIWFCWIFQFLRKNWSSSENIWTTGTVYSRITWQRLWLIYLSRYLNINFLVWLWKGTASRYCISDFRGFFNLFSYPCLKCKRCYFYNGAEVWVMS